MRGSFSIDFLMAAFLMVTLLGAIVPSWDVYVEAVRHASCSYLKDNLAAWKLLDANAAPSTAFVDGWVEVNREGIFVWGEAC
ncbi:MAG: hypothetical protein GXO00_00565 [Candidatus Diapherotrites archaeon]|nr:hypothetical protein [Candidatus Diapherotrites archaeon]